MQQQKRFCKLYVQAFFLTFSKQVLVIVVAVKPQPFLWGVQDALFFYVIGDVVGVVYCFSGVVVVVVVYTVQTLRCELYSSTTKAAYTPIGSNNTNKKV